MTTGTATLNYRPYPGHHGATMRTCRLVIIIGSAALIVFATAETSIAVTGGSIHIGIRAWILALVLLSGIAVATLAILDRLGRIEETNRARSATRRAEHDYDRIQTHLRSDNITDLYPEE